MNVPAESLKVIVPAGPSDNLFGLPRLNRFRDAGAPGTMKNDTLTLAMAVYGFVTIGHPSRLAGPVKKPVKRQVGITRLAHRIREKQVTLNLPLLK